jgi:chromosome segregation ATPase
MDNKNYKEAVQILAKTIEEMKELNLKSNSLVGEIKEIDTKIIKNNSSLKEFKEGISKLNEKLNEQEEKINLITKSIASITNKVESLITSTANVENNVKKLSNKDQDKDSRKTQEKTNTKINPETSDGSIVGGLNKDTEKEVLVHEALKGLGYKEYIRIIKALNDKIPSKVILNTMVGSTKTKTVKFEEVKLTYDTGEYKNILNKILNTPKSSKHKEEIDSLLK